MPTTTATSLLALAAAGLDAPTARAGDSIERLVASLTTNGWPAGGVAEADLRRRCGADVVCAARQAVALGDGRGRLEPNHLPDSDTIRWAKTAPSLTDLGRASDGHRRVALNQFGRKVEAELRAVLVDLEAPRLVLDLRANRGGDFARMLRVAGQILGPIEGALTLVGPTGTRAVDIPASGPPMPLELTLLVGPQTASSGEVLAALLRRYAGARVLGAPTAGKDYLLHIVPLDQDWRLLVPGEQILVPGEPLAGGLRPDGPLPAGSRS